MFDTSSKPRDNALMRPSTLVLLDIDGTLLDTQDAGIVAYERAAIRLFGVRFSFEGVSVHGRLDHENYADAVRRHGLDVDHRAEEPAFRAAYAEALAEIADDAGGFRACPDVAAFLAAMLADDTIELGLLTGNWEETGRLKIRHAGIDDAIFRVNAFADHGDHRDELVPVAIAAFESTHASRPSRTIVVGDTPRDVQCALAGDAVALAVATGIHESEVLRDAGAHRVVETLDPTHDLLEFIRHG